MEASLNVHLQVDGRNIKRIQDDFKCMLNKVHSCEDNIDVVQQGQKTRRPSTMPSWRGCRRLRQR